MSTYFTASGAGAVDVVELHGELSRGALLACFPGWTNKTTWEGAMRTWKGLMLVNLWILLTPGSVLALPVTWTLQDVLINNGGGGGNQGLLTGSFDFDPDLATFSNVAITSPAGVAITCVDDAAPANLCDTPLVPTLHPVDEQMFGDANVLTASDTRLVLLQAVDAATNRVLLLNFASLLTASGTSALATSVEYFCTPNVTCGMVDVDVTPFRSIVGPQGVLVAATSVPEPASFGLLALALLALAVATRRDASRSGSLSTRALAAADAVRAACDRREGRRCAAGG
jgi:hypothetical protein